MVSFLPVLPQIQEEVSTASSFSTSSKRLLLVLSLAAFLLPSASYVPRPSLQLVFFHHSHPFGVAPRPHHDGRRHLLGEPAAST